MHRRSPALVIIGPCRDIARRLGLLSELAMFAEHGDHTAASLMCHGRGE
jgi:hypothetical protein